MRRLLLLLVLLVCAPLVAQATDIMVSSFTVANSHGYTGTVRLRVFYTGCLNGQPFLTSDSQAIMCGSVGAATGFYKEINLTVNGSGTITIPAFVLPSTDDASPPTVRATAIFFVAGARRDNLFTNWVITNTLGASVTYPQLAAYQPNALPSPPPATYLTAAQIAALIQTSVGTSNDASSAVKGHTKLSIDPTVSTNPIAVGTNETDWANLQSGIISKTGVLSFRADTDSSGTDGIVFQTRGADKLTLDNAGTVLKLGDSSVTTASRIEQKTQSTDVYSHGILTSNFTNGVTCGSTNYKDQTFNIGYNSNTAGVKINSGLVNFGLAFESKFCQSPAAAFQFEHYLSFTDPTGVLSIRPWGMVIQHTTLDNSFTMQGDINFFRNLSAGGAQTAFWHETGLLEFTVPAGSIAFKNNACASNGGLRYFNAAGNNTFGAICVDSSDRTVIGTGGGGSDVLVAANNMTANTIYASTLGGNGDTDTFFNFAGSNQILAFSGGSAKFAIEPAGVRMISALTFDIDNTYDLGKTSGTNFRPRDVYVGRNLEVGTDINGVLGSVAPKAVTGTTVTANTSLTVNSGTPVLKFLSATGSLDFTALAANSCEVLTITVSGAADGDTVNLGVPNALADVDGATERTTFFGWVSGANTVSVRRCNITGTITADPAAATVRAEVTKY